MTSEIRANKQTNRAGLGTVTYADTGIIVSGIVTCTELSGLTALNIAGVGTASTLDINGDIDVDGHTNLDNLSIAGVTTFSGNIGGTATFQDIDVDGHTNLDNVSIAGVTTMSGNLTISNTDPQLTIHDTNHNPSHYYLKGVGGAFKITDSTNGDRISFNSNGSISVTASLFNIVGAAQVSSNLGVTGNLILTDNIIHDGDTDTKIRFPAADQISFETSGTEYLKLHRYSSVNFVEVGASATLSLANNGSGNRYIVIGDGNASSTGALKLQAGGGSTGWGGGITMYSHANTTNAGGVYIGKSLNSSGAIIFGNGGTSPSNEYLRIDSNGSLLINGTTSFGSPVKLQVRGASSAISDGGQIFDIASTAASNGGTRLAFGVNEDTYTWIRSYESGVGSRDLVFAGVSEYGRFTSGGVFNLNNIVQVGTTNDTGELRIGHDGSNYRARIVSNSSNSLEIDADGPERIQMHGGVIYMRPINSEKSAAFVANGSAELYYDDVKKFQTTSSGSHVLGTFSSTPQNNSQKGAYFGPYVIDNSQSAQTDDTVDIRSLKGVALDLTRYYTSGDIQTFRINNDYEGAIYVSPTGVQYNSTSDYRLKENVINLTGAIDRVKQLKPKRFNFIKDPGNTIDGFMAHEVSSVVPNAVMGEKDATMTT